MASNLISCINFTSNLVHTVEVEMFTGSASTAKKNEIRQRLIKLSTGKAGDGDELKLLYVTVGPKIYVYNIYII